MPTNYITLTRQELYDLVWSKPMTTLAKEFGITDVGLAKRCRTVDVPIPYRGYWARKAAGQELARIPLPKYRNRTTPNDTATAPAETPLRTPKKEVIRDGAEPTVYFGRPPPRPDLAADIALAATPAERVFRERLAALSVIATTTLATTTAAVRRTARHLKHPDRATLPFSRGERSGPTLAMSVTSGTLNRALLFADQLLRIAHGLGWSFSPPPPPKEPGLARSRWDPPAPRPRPAPPIGRLMVDGVAIEFQIDERRRKTTPDRSAHAKNPQSHPNQHSPSRAVYEPTGRLCVSCLAPHSYGDRRGNWYDRGNRRIEDKIPEILWFFQQLATRTLFRQAEAEEAERKRRECERRELELSIRRGHHAKLVEELERQAGAWFRATMLRRYLRDLRRVAGEGQIQSTLGDEKVDFLLWAEQYVNQLDPLDVTPRVPEMAPECRYSYSSDSEVHNVVARLLGRYWHQSFKFNSSKPSQDQLQET